MSGTIRAIYCAAKFGEEALPVDEAEVNQAGLLGDRHHGTGVISLIEEEQVAHFNQATGLHVTGAESRRNVLTQGIDLNALEGKTFQLGPLTVEGFELCEPCANLGAQLATAEVNDLIVVKQFVNRAGLRVRVLEGAGTLKPGDPVG